MHARSAQCIPRCPHNSFPAENLRTPTHSDTPSPSTSYRPLSPNARPRCPEARAQCAMHAPPTSQPIPRRRLPLAHAAPTPSPSTSAPSPNTSAPPPRDDAFLVDRTTHSPPKAVARPRTATRPSRALLLPHATPTHARRLRDAFPADRTTPSPQRHAASPSIPLRAQKNGTAQCMCDAECLGRPSLRSVIGVGEPRAVRRRCGALAWRVGLRPQPWALRSRRCGRVLRA